MNPVLEYIDGRLANLRVNRGESLVISGSEQELIKVREVIVEHFANKQITSWHWPDKEPDPEFVEVLRRWSNFVNRKKLE